MFKDNPEGQTHSYNDGCGEPVHNGVKIPIEKMCEQKKHTETCCDDCYIEGVAYGQMMSRELVREENLAWLEGRRCVECGGAKEQGLSDTCKGCLENA